MSVPHGEKENPEMEKQKYRAKETERGGVRERERARTLRLASKMN